ncbi:MAG: SDR family NAD(P)-dependent oxidoreductase [Marinilabiliales bacterium]|nr:SDR family NAD(P)-dependent oxidoreductase [Marinilabiliales bacterium]
MRKVVLITGISSGFGKETARILAEQGHSVYGTVRSDSGLFGEVKVLKMDLTDTVSMQQAVRRVVEQEGRIDVLINNAGMHTGGPIETSPNENIRLQMETSFMGMVNLTREVLPVMRRNWRRYDNKHQFHRGIDGTSFPGVLFCGQVCG